MRLFVKKLVVLIIFVCIVVGVLELIIRSNYNSYSYKNYYVQENGNKIETVVLGTSHAYAGVNPYYFKSHTFNFANSAQPLKVDFYTLQRYDSDLVKLKNVILDLSYFSLRTNGYDTPGNEYYYINYNVFMGYKGDDFSKKNSFVFQNPALFRNYLTNIITKTNMRCDSLGQGNYYNINDKTVDTNINGKNEAIKQSSLKSGSYEVNLDYLNKIILYCKNRDIRLILISTPIWHTYYDNMNIEQYSELQGTINEIQKTHSCEYYNFMNDERFIEDDFMDSHHLSNIGAEKFSRILADTLKL